MNPDFWNEKFSQSEEPFYGVEPNPFFKQEIDKLKPGKILIPACGEGRDAIYAAQRGFDVTAVDYSAVAVEQTVQNQELHKVKMKVLHADLRHLLLAENSFDVVAPIYAHFPAQQRLSIHQKLVSVLKPGGKLILFGFNTNQLGHKSGGPKDEKMLFHTKMLSNDFAVLTDLTITEKTMKLNEGEGHKGFAHVIECTGIKKSK